MLREQIVQYPPTRCKATIQRPWQADIYDEDSKEVDLAPRTPTSTRRYQAAQVPTQTHIRVRHQTAIPPRASAFRRTEERSRLAPPLAPERQTSVFPNTSRRIGFLLLLLGVLLSILICAMLLNALFAWGKARLDDLEYGNPRTTQYDVVVGHLDDSAHPSHFIALNVHRQIEVIEIEGGDASHTKIYTGPFLAQDEQTPITLEFRDVLGNGKLDMLVAAGDTRIAFINENGSFRPMKSDEHINGGA